MSDEDWDDDESDNKGDYLSPPYRSAANHIERLPVRDIPDSIYQQPEISTPAKRQAWQEASQRIADIAATVAPENSSLVTIWASDAAAGAGDLERALAIFPRPKTLSRRSVSASKILSLKLELGLPMLGEDLLALYGPRLTKFGRENVEAVTRFLTVRLHAIQETEGRNILRDWSEDAHELKQGCNLFNGHASYIVCKSPRGYTFDLSKKAEPEALRLIRDAENTWREEGRIPRVGEGWISETTLFYQIKTAFADLEVLQHASPDWLGRQHLEIYIPSMGVAVEYHGLQHDQPVAFFGGEEAFLQNQKRDRNKKAKCTRNGVRMVYVREGYSLGAVVEQIRAAAIR